MRTFGLLGCALAVGALIGVGAPVQAEETGVASIHTWVKVGGKTCFVDHWHSGSGTGKTRSLAEKAAIQSWADFTAWEYGSTWGRYTLAAGRKATCEQGDSWSCSVEARPCKAR